MVSKPADRPFDDTPVHTSDLPDTPPTDRNIPAAAWVQAPASVLAAGDDIGRPAIVFRRRIGSWLLWRAGPARDADARWVAVHADDLRRSHTFRVFADGTGIGMGPGGRGHDSMRAWKQDLAEHE